MLIRGETFLDTRSPLIEVFFPEYLNLFKEYLMNQIFQMIEEDSKVAFSFENQYKRTTYVTVMPSSVNTSATTDPSTKKTSIWFHIVAQFKTQYASIDENGQVSDDANETIKQLFIKFPQNYLEEQKVLQSEFKKFLKEHFIGKRFLTLPVGTEGQKYEIKGDKLVAIKNQTETTISENFNLRAFIDEINQGSKKEPLQPSEKSVKQPRVL